MVQVLDWQSAANHGEIIATAVNVLSSGGLVVLPTDAGYRLAASASLPEAVERLDCDRAVQFLLTVRGAGELPDWLPDLSPRLYRLLRRCWPGPVILEATTGWQHGLAGRLPPPLRDRLLAAGRLTLAVPANESVAALLPYVPGPLVLSPVPGVNGTQTDSADEILQGLDNLATLVVRHDFSRLRCEPTVLQPDGDAWRVVHEGAVPGATLQRLSCCFVVFVCTGNTCRSPLADALCKKLLADHLDCTVSDLPERGFVVLSAGLSAMIGAEAALEAVEIARELGADLTQHASRTLTAELAAQADFLFVMTRSHLQVLMDYYPQLAGKARLLSPDGADVHDPIGAGLEVYRDCATQIRGYLERLLPEVLQS